MKYAAGLWKLFIFLLVALVNSTYSQISISGIVVNESNNEPLPFANVYTENGKGSITNERGRFLLQLDQLPAKLLVSYVGYHSTEINVNNEQSYFLIKLSPSTINLSSVEVLANDEKAAELSFGISQKIQNDMTYPGQVKVTVIRETRAVNVAK